MMTTGGTSDPLVFISDNAIIFAVVALTIITTAVADSAVVATVAPTLASAENMNTVRKPSPPQY